MEKDMFGYKITKFIEVPEINSKFYFLKHKKTFSEHIHIKNDDSENVFGIAFKTSPSNSRGVAHVLEHTVLCGSLRFPVKDPFFSMLKRSLATFMNAFTSSDWTMYPFSTQHKKDYYNLMSVYMDSVFFPKIDELSFEQEGCKIQLLDKKNNEIKYKGIVYNEMKGVMSSPDQILIRSLLNSLYSDTIYKNDSGGDPVKIPLLSHKELKKFHKKYYHPSNSFFITYGNLPLENHLKYINNSYLKYFKYNNSKIEVSSQKRWEKNRKSYCFYNIEDSKFIKKKCQVTLSWLTCDVRDTSEVFILNILEQILLGNDASPLKKALMDSNLGSTLSDGSGYDSENRDTVFSCGLKDVNANDAEKIENIILNELIKLYNKGIDQILINSVIHQFEFSKKEITNKPYPFGIKLFLEISACWFHGGNIASYLKTEKKIIEIKNKVKKGGFFEKRIKKYFIDNKHRLLFILKPDKKIEKNELKRLSYELSKIKDKSINSNSEKFFSNCNNFDIHIEKKENLECLPTLKLKDIPKEVNIVSPPIKLFKRDNIFTYDQKTSNILYFYGLIGLGGIEVNILDYIPFFCYSISKLDTYKSDYLKISQYIDLFTGGINFFSQSHTICEKKELCLPIISLNMKCLSYNKEKAVNLIKEIMTQINFKNPKRILQLIFEYKAAIESTLIYNAHNIAISMVEKNLSHSSFLNEKWSVINQLRLISSILKNKDNDSINKVISILKHISNSIFLNNNLKLAIIGEKKEIQKRKDIYDLFPNHQSKKESKKEIINFKNIKFNLEEKPTFEGWTTSTSVSFVAQSFKTVKLDNKDAPILSVISKILKSMYLHKEIREKGGAYGALSIYNSENGLFTFCSYRDPHIVKTLEVYNNVENFLISNKIREEDIKESILQVCAEIDKPDTPSISAKKDFLRTNIKIKNSVRQVFKSRLLKINKEDIMKISEKYFKNKNSKKSVVVVSNNRSILSANKKLKRNKLVIKKI